MPNYESADEWDSGSRYVNPNEVDPTAAGEILPLPEQIDEAWCDIVTSVYKNGERSARIITDHCLREIIVPSDSGKVKAFQPIRFTPFRGEYPGVEGRFVGIKLHPANPFGRKGIFMEPHAILRMVTVEDNPSAVSTYPEQDVLVPLDPDLRRLLLF